MEQRNAVPQGTARPRPPRTAEERQRDRRLALSLLTRLAQDDLVLYRQEGVLRLGRVAAVGGDVVMLEEDGTLRVNGTLHAGEVLYPTYPAGGVTYPYTVPEGCLFILNDYRTHGRDSRHFGAVPQQAAAGCKGGRTCCPIRC